MRADDTQILLAVIRAPYATAFHLSRLWGVPDVRHVYRSLARLRDQGYVQVIEYRDRHYKTTTVKLNFVTEDGVAALEVFNGWQPDEVYTGTAPVSREWQRHLAKHPDIVGMTYDYVCAIKTITGKRPAWYFPRQGSFDAWIWDDWQDGLSIGIIRMGPTLGLTRLSERISAMRRGDDLTCHHEEYGGRRGPGLVLISVPTELEKHWVSDWFTLSGRFGWGTGIRALVATEEEASRCIWTVPTDGRLVDIDDIACYQPAKSKYDPRVPPAYKWTKPLPVKKLPLLLSPVQSRIMDCLYRWPLMRPTEIAPTVGVPYNGPFNAHIKTLSDRGLVKDIREIHQAGLLDYDRGEYRDFPRLLTDKGLLHLAARDRTKSGRNRARSGGQDKNKPPGLLDKWGTEGVDEHGTRYLGSDIGKLVRELDHTFGANAAVARMCRELPYTADVLPDHLNRRYYKTSRWTENEFLVTSSVAPDAALVLRKDDFRRTVLLEYERHATQGGKALTRKLKVWVDYSRNRGGRYLGRKHHEVVAFIVPTEKSLDLLANRLQSIIPSYIAMIEVVVITESDFYDTYSVMHDRIWTLATDPKFPKVRLNLS